MALIDAGRLPVAAGRRAGRDFGVFEEAAGGEDEHLADHVRVLLVTAHEADHPPPGRVLDDRFKALAHDLLERHPLLDHGRSPAAFQEGPFDGGEPAAEQADDDIVLVVGLGLGWASAVVLLEELHETVGDGREDLAVGFAVGGSLIGLHHLVILRDLRCMTECTARGCRLEGSSVGFCVLCLARDPPDQRAMKGSTMAPSDDGVPGDRALDGIRDAMVAMHERYHGRSPVAAKSLWMGDDLLVCVLGGVYTDVEKTMIELQRATIVQETRSAFQEAMQQKFIDVVERLSGRRVLAFISNQHVGPDLEVELFVLAPTTEDFVAG
jgi:uncharacterized protein YbcI